MASSTIDYNCVLTHNNALTYIYTYKWAGAEIEKQISEGWVRGSTYIDSVLCMFYCHAHGVIWCTTTLEYSKYSIYKIGVGLVRSALSLVNNDIVIQAKGLFVF